jgi:hypothetical protein
LGKNKPTCSDEPAIVEGKDMNRSLIVGILLHTVREIFRFGPSFFNNNLVAEAKNLLEVGQRIGKPKPDRQGALDQTGSKQIQSGKQRVLLKERSAKHREIPTALCG